jgi:hypothetical protein
MPKKFFYETILQIFSDKKCKLLLSLEEFKQLPKNTTNLKFNFIASCGHESNSHFTNFFHKNTGVICRTCTYKNIGKKQKEKEKITSEASNASIKEAIGFKILEDILKNDFDILKCNEGCISDMIIKPKNISENKWLMIQLKTTQGICHDIYSFKGLNKNYVDCIILCISLDDQKMWIFEHNIIKHLKNSLSIGKKNSIYKKYEVNNNYIGDVLNNYYITYNLYTNQECMTPQSKLQQQEQVYANQRIEKLNFLLFEKPKIDNTVYDFIMNGYKHQEKVATIRKDRKSCVVGFYKYDTIILINNKKKRKNQLYVLGDNDFYWFWIKNSTLFYIIPELILYENKLISREYKSGRIYMSLYTNKIDKYENYKFYFDNLDKDKLLKLLEPKNVKSNVYIIKIIEHKIEHIEEDKPKLENIKEDKLKNKKEYKCLDCNIDITNKGKRCNLCSKINQRKVKERPTKELLLNEVKLLGYSAVGRKYSVSDNTIRKWLK